MSQAVKLHVVLIDVGTYDFLSVGHIIYSFTHLLIFLFSYFRIYLFFALGSPADANAVRPMGERRN